MKIEDCDDEELVAYARRLWASDEYKVWKAKLLQGEQENR